MPANRLEEIPIAVRQYDVGGQDSEEILQFVSHVGLSLENNDGLTSDSARVMMIHMGPPLFSDDLDNAEPVHCIATVELTADEILQIQVFIDELTSEYQAEKARPYRQYIICPHTIEPDEKIPFRRFNCAGFAVEAYRDAGIELIHLDEDALPKVTLETLKQAYQDRAEELDKPRLRNAYGLPGDGPWPVLLAGYVVNSMAREALEIRNTPYTASLGDEFFPRRP